MLMSRALFRFANLQAVRCLESVPHSRFGAVLAERERDVLTAAGWGFPYPRVLQSCCQCVLELSFVPLVQLPCSPLPTPLLFTFY